MGDSRKDNKLFIGGLSKTTNAAALKDYFSGFGEVVDSVVMTDKDTGEHRGFGFVTFQEFAHVQSCLKQPSHLVDNVQVEVKRAVPKDKMKEPQPLEVETTKVFVGGLSPDTSKEDVEEALADYGIVSAKIMTRMGSEKPRGFAFAYFDTVKSAQLVAKIKWFKILDRNAECKLAVPKDGMEGSTSNPRIPRALMAQPQHQGPNMGRYQNNYSPAARYGGQQPFGYNAPGFGSGGYSLPAAGYSYGPSGYPPSPYNMYSGNRDYMAGAASGMMTREYSQNPSTYGPARGSADKDRIYGRNHTHPYSGR